MEFRDTLLAAQRNQQQKSSESNYYKARFDPPKKEQKQKDKLSANIQKFLAKKDEEERQKKLEAQRKREELLAMRDPKALRKIQKTLKVIKSANKSVIEDAVDRDNTAITRAGPDQPDQDDYGYESQEAAALYEKMMEKYSKMPDEPKFPVGHSSVKKDLNGTRERVKHALQHEDDPQPHKRKRKTADAGNAEREPSPPPKYEPEKEKEKEKDKKPEKPKFRKPMPPPMDFNQLLKLAEQKKSEPLEVATKKQVAETSEPERLMTKKQKREYEEELARRQRRQERIEAERSGKRIQRDDRPAERERKPETSGFRTEPSTFGRIPKIGEKANAKHGGTKNNDREREQYEKERERERFEKEKERERYERAEKQRERDRIIREKEREILDRERAERERVKADRERLDRLKAERDRIDREMERLNRDREKLDKTKAKLESRPLDKKPLDKVADRSKLSSNKELKKSIDLKSQNTYRIDKNSNDNRPMAVKSDTKYMNGHSLQGKGVPKLLPPKESMKDRALLTKKVEGAVKNNGLVKEDRRLPEIKGATKRPDSRAISQAGPSKPKISNSFDFDKHVSSMKGRQFPPGDVKRKPQSDDRKKVKRRLESDEEYDSEMDDFIDDGDENMDYSKHIKEIFGYDKSKYRDMDDDDDPTMESSFVQQQREEFISKKIGIMEDLEDMRLEAMEKKKKKKTRRISDD